MTESRFLITTADERTWRSDRPVLFLGEWCRLYARKQVWSRMDAVVAQPYGLGAGQKERDIAYVHASSNRLLNELTDALNSLHNTRHAMRYWQIVLGNWLERYVAVFFNRYVTLELALSQHDVSATTVFDSTDYSLATTDSDAFVWACNDDVWNHVLYTKILKFFTAAKIEMYSAPLGGASGFVPNEYRRAKPLRNARRLMVDAAHHLLPGLSRNEDAFIINSYLPRREELKLQFRLGQCPQMWRSPTVKTVAPDPKQRQCLSIPSAHHEGFERYVREELSDLIPTCYVEGYDQLTEQVKSLRWPSRPKFIFTSNNFDTDEIFKAWAGAKVEGGTPYFVGQHGSNYGTFLGSKKWPELVTCDRFFTWGWKDEDPRHVPAFVLRTAGRKPQGHSSMGGLLLIETVISHLITAWDSYFEFLGYLDEQFRFAAALPATIQEKLTVRLHAEYGQHNLSEKRRWKDRNPHVKIDSGAIPIQSLIARSRLVVYSYDSSGMLETLASNIPTMCFWPGGLSHLLDEAKPYYELLRAAGILCDSPEQAAEMVASRWDQVSTWWQSKPVQDARGAFCAQYARTEMNPVGTLKESLVAHANQCRGRQARSI